MSALVGAGLRGGCWPGGPHAVPTSQDQRAREQARVEAEGRPAPLRLRGPDVPEPGWVGEGLGTSVWPNMLPANTAQPWRAVARQLTSPSSAEGRGLQLHPHPERRSPVCGSLGLSFLGSAQLSFLWCPSLIWTQLLPANQGQGQRCLLSVSLASTASVTEAGSPWKWGGGGGAARSPGGPPSGPGPARLPVVGPACQRRQRGSPSPRCGCQRTT